MSPEDPINAAGDRLVKALRARAAEVGFEHGDDHQLLEKLEAELKEDGDRRAESVAALRQRLAKGDGER